jgi:hypothetical protein
MGTSTPMVNYAAGELFNNREATACADQGKQLW